MKKYIFTIVLVTVIASGCSSKGDKAETENVYISVKDAVVASGQWIKEKV